MWGSVTMDMCPLPVCFFSCDGCHRRLNTLCRRCFAPSWDWTPEAAIGVKDTVQGDTDATRAQDDKLKTQVFNMKRSMHPLFVQMVPFMAPMRSAADQRP